MSRQYTWYGRVDDAGDCVEDKSLGVTHFEPDGYFWDGLDKESAAHLNELRGINKQISPHEEIEIVSPYEYRERLSHARIEKIEKSLDELHGKLDRLLLRQEMAQMGLSMSALGVSDE